MLFNSYSFLFYFLPLTIIAYYGLWFIQGVSKAKYVILFSSILFYAFGARKFVLLLLFSIFINYILGKLISQGKEKSKIYLVAGIAFNLVILTYYKYFGFIIQNLNFFCESGFERESIILPLGISFFTFTQIAFLVDMYSASDKKTYSLSEYSLLVSFFPHLIAGPLLHHSQFIPQWSKLSFPIDYEKIYKGLVYFSIGLFKKVLLADPIGQYANVIFTNGAMDSLEAWLGSLSFSLQLFLDFSGYSDMAVGLALLLQIQIPQNFNAPYRALDIQDFWNRWHISLSQFLKNYLYIPLGGNRLGFNRTIINTMVTFLLGGLWHGASWTFVIWGGLHAIGLIVHRIYKKLGISLPNFLAWIVTIIFVNTCWVFFKSSTIQQSFVLINQMYDTSTIMSLDFAKRFLGSFGLISFLIYGIFTMFSTESIYEKVSKHTWGSVVLGFALSIILFMMRRETIFLYFNF